VGNIRRHSYSLLLAGVTGYIRMPFVTLTPPLSECSINLALHSSGVTLKTDTRIDMRKVQRLGTLQCNLPQDSISNVARFRLRAHTLRVEALMTWTYNTSPDCDLCSAFNVQDERHVLFYSTHPRVVSLQDLCVPVSSHRFQLLECVCFSEPEQQ